MIVRNSSKKIIVIGKVNLYPKVNLITNEQETILINFKEDLEDNSNLVIESFPEIYKLKENKENKENETVKSITSIIDLGKRKAISLIKDTVILSSLKTYLKDEKNDKNRSDVVKAIKDQIKKIEV